ncbi:MAG: hypothetical protein HZA90_27615 [Verrucomicrobia bacterium]|nr:hypothetical protein [Verrucomicrobiota bacterium]
MKRQFSKQSWSVVARLVMAGVLFLSGSNFNSLAVLAPQAATGMVTLTWDPSPDASVVGYNIYHGAVGGNVTNKLVLGNSTTITIMNLEAERRLFFFVTAYDSQFVESDPSNVITNTPHLPPNPNTPPVPDAIPDMAAVAGRALSFTVTAHDADTPAQKLTFNLDPGAPAGASIDPDNGLFTWTPSSSQAGTMWPVMVRVWDNGMPPFDTAVMFNVMVQTPTSGLVASNTPPTVSPIADQVIVAGNLLSMTVTGHDPDVPAQTLTYQLDPGYPAGASIDPVSGVFAWRPGLAQADTAFPITIRVRDNGTPAYDHAAMFNVLVQTPAPTTNAPSPAPTTAPTPTTPTTPPSTTAPTPPTPPTSPASGNATTPTAPSTQYSGSPFTSPSPSPAVDTNATATPAVTNTPAAPAAPALSAPAPLRAVLAGAHHVRLEWGYGSDSVDGFRIEQSLDGVNYSGLGTVGRASRRFSVDDKDVPYAFAYPYYFRVCAFKAGEQSPWSNPACAISNRADLVVTALRMTPATPVEGDSVIFKATLKNIGQAASPQGVDARVAIYVDGGEAVAWADCTTTLWPGQSITLAATNGPGGAHTWSATAGTHTLSALADDANLVAEQNENNNRLDRMVAVAPANAPEVSVSLDKASLAEGSTDVATFTFTRTGSLAADLSVQINVTGTARDGFDFSYVSNFVVIPAGQSAVAVAVTATDDLLAEPKETVMVSLVPAAGYRLATQSSATLAIDDSVKPATSSTSAARPAYKLITARPSASGDAIITWSSVPGTIYQVFAREVNSGQWTLLCPAVPATGRATCWTNETASGVMLYAVAAVK